jgi:putative nucleotidyltransferase with HDIG domain
MLAADRLNEDPVMVGSGYQKTKAERPLGHSRAEGAHGGDWASLLAGTLARELSAPVGICDPDQRTWKVIVGAQESDFPRIDNSMLEVAGSSGLRLGRAALWRPKDEPGRVWLVLPLPWAEVADIVAFAGFQASQENRGKSEGECKAPPPEPVAHLAWGPPCPDAALRAWGQQIVNRLQSNLETRVYPVEPTLANENESERMVIGRLIRRMRISDSPTRFQGLATNVLKTSLGMTAVAWVPSDARETVVVSGEIAGLHPADYRTMLPVGPGEPAYVVNDATSDSMNYPSGVYRFACVPAGAAGWLVAVNPSQGRAIGTSEIERMRYVASLIATQSSNAQIYTELKELLFGIIRALTAAIDAKDPYTSGHSERVARIAVRLAEELGMPPQKRSDLYLAGLLHDVGKIGVDDHLLKRNGPLSPDEYRIIQGHVEIGVTILKDLKKLHHILPGVRHHHESMDGSGYPDHLSGEGIPLEARILSVADSFDAMSSNRPYRRRLTPLQIDDIFRKGRGAQWDPQVVDALFSCRMDLEAIRQKGLGESLVGAVNVTLGRA